MTLPQRLLETLSALSVPSRYCVAYSGGRDSHVLLDAMAGLRDRLPAPVAALHVDHGLQPGSGQWAGHCERVCRQLGLSLRVLSLQLEQVPGRSLEELARQARYRALARAMRSGEMLLTAHHQEDQAETVLLQLLRGAGPAGLAAMPRVTAFGPGRHLRPLLEEPAAELAAYAARRRLAWVEDPSNRETGFDRNYLRREVMPLLRQRWPALGRTLSRSARHCAEVQGLVDGFAAADLARLQDPDSGALSLPGLAALAPDRARALLRAWIRKSGFRLPDTARLERIRLEMTGAGKDRNPLVHWPGAEVRRYRERLYLMPPLPPIDRGLALAWEGTGMLQLPAGLGRLRATPGDGGLARRHWEGGRVEVRFQHQGERLRLPGRAGSRRFSHFCQQHAIPPWQRPRLPLVFIDGHLAAVADLVCCEPFAAARGEPGVQLQWQRGPWCLPAQAPESPPFST